MVNEVSPSFPLASIDGSKYPREITGVLETIEFTLKTNFDLGPVEAGNLLDAP